jgi:hypothetical protein
MHYAWMADTASLQIADKNAATAAAVKQSVLSATAGGLLPQQITTQLSWRGMYPWCEYVRDTLASCKHMQDITHQMSTMRQTHSMPIDPVGCVYQLHQSSICRAGCE